MTVYCPESDTTYADFAAFEAAEQGATDKTAQITGKVAGGTIQGWTGHLTIEAASSPYDGTNSSTCDGLSSVLRIRNNNVTLSKTSKIFIEGGNDRALIIGVFEVVTNISASGGCKTNTGNSNYYGIETYSGAGCQYDIDEFIVEQSGAGVWFRAASTATVNHLTVVQSSAGQGFRGGIDNDAGAIIKNTLAIADPAAGQDDYYGSSYGAASDYLASGDASASTFAATTSYTSQTAAELVDIAGGDFRTKSTSTLATGGEAGTWIGGILEAAGGITVTGVTPSYNYNSIAGVIDLTGEISVLGATPSYSYNSIAGVVGLVGEITVTGQTPQYNYNSVNGVIDLTGEINVTGNTPSYSFTAISGVIDLTPEISVTGATPIYSYNAVNGNVDLSSQITVVGQTASYNYNSINGDVLLAGEILVTGQTPQFNFNAIRGSVFFAGGNDFSNITVSFADSGIGVEYKQDEITVKFKG